MYIEKVHPLHLFFSLFRLVLDFLNARLSGLASVGCISDCLVQFLLTLHLAMIAIIHYHLFSGLSPSSSDFQNAVGLCMKALRSLHLMDDVGEAFQLSTSVTEADGSKIMDIVKKNLLGMLLCFLILTILIRPYALVPGLITD
jgi:hypothetical protein